MLLRSHIDRAVICAKRMNIIYNLFIIFVVNSIIFAYTINMALFKNTCNRILSAIAFSIVLVLLNNCTNEAALIEVEALTMSQPSAEIEEGTSIQLYASITPSNATEKKVTWSSSKLAVATVSDEGLVSAVSTGTSTITALAGAKTASCVITVVKAVVHITRIELDKTTLTLVEGDQHTLVPIIYPSDATDKSVSWSSSQENIATVDNGVVTAVSPGNAKIIAKTQDGGKVAECDLIVEKKLAPSVSVGASHITCVSACLIGRTNIEQLSSSAEVGIAYSTSATTLVASPVFCKAESFSSSEDYEIYVINLEPNTKYFYRSYVSYNGENYYGDVQEFTTKELTDMVETMDASDIEASSAKLNARIDLTDVKGNDLAYGIQWHKSNIQDFMFVESNTLVNNIATITISGLSHNTTYSYRAVVKINGKEYRGNVKEFTTGVIPVSGVRLDQHDYHINQIGSAFTLVATVSPDDATNKGVDWTSSNPNVATVDNRGNVTVVGNGTTSITVTTKDQGKTDTCILTVAQLVTGVSLNKTTLALYEGESQTLAATISPDNAADKSLKWSSSNENVAIVDNNGKLTALKKGTTTIKALTNDGSDISSECTVTVSYACPVGAVDLGFTTSDGYKLYWATCNLGATNPEEYGDRYAWGETETKDSYWPQDYTLFKGEMGWMSTTTYGYILESILKYNLDSSLGPVDNKTVLEPEDDVASVKLGSHWRIPLEAEQRDLYNKCDWVWTTINEIYGFKLTSRVEGYTDKWIFLPAAAGYNDTMGHYYGYYWSSCLSTSNSWYAYLIQFQDPDKPFYTFSQPRYYGFSVRPVFDGGD